MPQVISFKSTREQVTDVLTEALAILDEFVLEPDERAHLLPVVVGLLADKPIGMQPDGPAIDLNALRSGRH